MFLKSKYTGFLSIEDVNKGQSNVLKVSNDINKGEKSIEKKPFIIKVTFFVDGREKILNTLKSNIFPIKNSDEIPASEPTRELKSNSSVFNAAEQRKAQTKNAQHKISPAK